MIKWDAPASAEPRLSWVVLVPAAAMRDVEGNGPGYAVRDTLRDLARALSHQGHLVCRFEQESPLDFEGFHMVLEKAMENPETQGLPLVLLGVAEGADLIAREYFEVLTVQSPSAMVLLSPSVRPIHLNNINCPYLIVHGKEDPLFESLPYDQIKAAVHHHEMRFPDPTVSFLLPGFGRELGEAILDERVTEEVVRWLRKALAYTKQWKHWAEKRKVA